MSQIIVTRNVIPNTQGKFAARHTDQKELLPRESVVVRNAKFTETYAKPEYKVEANFGCGVICVGDLSTSVPSEELDDLQEIFFDGMDFCAKETGRRVGHARAIIFGKNKILAAI